MTWGSITVPPGGDPAHRVDELGGVGDPVLEQIADGAVAGGQQFVGVELLDVLGEHEDGQAGPLAAGLQRRLEALVGEGRRQAHVDDRHVRLLVQQRAQQGRAVVHRGDDLAAVLLEGAYQPVPQQEEVFGEDNAHGISIVTVVGPPGGLCRARVPSKVSNRRRTPVSPVPPRDVGAAAPVVGDRDPQQCALVLKGDVHLAGAGVLHRVGQHLADREVGGRLDRRGEPARQAGLDMDVEEAVERQGPYGVAEPAVGEYGRVDAADQAAQVLQRLRGRPADVQQQLTGGRRVAVQQPDGALQRHAQGDEPGLRTVVQIALDAPQLGGLGVHRLGAGAVQPVHAPREFGAARRGQQPPPPTGSAAAAPRARRTRPRP
ncbi:hypothetical protein GCM10020000_33060 [Streptomyces olivoverticillatus]